MPQRFTLASLKDPTQLFTIIQRLSADLESTQHDLQLIRQDSARSKLTLVDFRSIKAALQAGGSSPLNVSQLIGILSQSQRGYAVIASSLTALQSSKPDLYEVGTLGIVTGSPIQLYYVSEGVPRVWTGPVSVAPTNMVTTDSVQNIGPGAQKTFKDNVSMEGIIDKYKNLATTGMGVSPVLANYSVSSNPAASIGSTVVYTAGAAGQGLYRVNFYILIIAGTGGTITFELTYHDGVVARTYTSAPITLAAAGVMCNGITGGIPTLVLLGNSQSISYDTIITGATGSPIYLIFMAVDRMT